MNEYNERVERHVYWEHYYDKSNVEFSAKGMVSVTDIGKTSVFSLGFDKMNNAFTLMGSDFLN
jgi:hypothetical protein